jgi:hypothetical protein
LRHKEVPFSERKLRVAGGEASAEMILPGLDGSFGRVATMMDVRRDALEIDLVFLEGVLEVFRTFVVKNMKIWGVAVELESCVQCSPSFGEFAGLPSLEWLGEDRIAIIMIENHYVVVSSRRLDRKLASLVGVRLANVGG